MAIPAAIIEVIRLAKEQEAAEAKLETLKASKSEYQTLIAGLNEQITDQQSIVAAARIALKAAANKI